VKVEGRVRDAGLWPRLLGFALVPLTVQVFQPTVGGILGILTPLPLAYGMARRGFLEGTAAVAFVAFLTTIVAGSNQGLFFLLETLPLCVGICWAARARTPLYRSVMLAVGLVVLTAFVSVMVYSLYTGQALGEIYREMVQRMGLFTDGFSDTSGLGPEEVQQIQWLMDLWRRLFTGIWVSTLIFLVTFYALLIRNWMLAAGTIEAEGLALLSGWALPFPFVLLFILVALIVLLTEGTVGDAAVNLLIPLGALYEIQGVIVAGHMFTLWALSPFIRVLFLTFGVITFPLVFLITIALVGLFDTWIDFRRRWPLPEPPAPPLM
jgi:hypothetical protein